MSGCLLNYIETIKSYLQYPKTCTAAAAVLLLLLLAAASEYDGPYAELRKVRIVQRLQQGLEVPNHHLTVSSDSQEVLDRSVLATVASARKSGDASRRHLNQFNIHERHDLTKP